jgi:hypothetical protein
MRPIYWGLALSLGGICSSVLLGLISPLFIMPVTSTLASMSGYYEAPPFYIVDLTYIAKAVTLFSLPSAMAIEALKVRKGEVKENEGA